MFRRNEIKETVVVKIVDKNIRHGQADGKGVGYAKGDDTRYILENFEPEFVGKFAKVIVNGRAPGLVFAHISARTIEFKFSKMSERLGRNVDSYVTFPAYCVVDMSEYKTDFDEDDVLIEIELLMEMEKAEAEAIAEKDWEMHEKQQIVYAENDKRRKEEADKKVEDLLAKGVIVFDCTKRSGYGVKTLYAYDPKVEGSEKIVMDLIGNGWYSCNREFDTFWSLPKEIGDQAQKLHLKDGWKFRYTDSYTD